MSTNTKPKYYWLVAFESGRVQVHHTEVKYDQEFFGPENYEKAVLPKVITKTVDFESYQSLEQKLAEANKALLSLRKEFISGADGVQIGCECGLSHCTYKLNLSRGDAVYVVSYVDKDKFDDTLSKLNSEGDL